MPIVVECEQGSSAWFEARCGSITASMFAEIRKVANGLDERQQAFVTAVQAGQSRKDAAEAAGYKTPPKSERIERALAGEKVGDYTDAALNYAFRLAMERISGTPLDEGFTNWAARRGHELEPEARATHALHIGRSIQRAGVVLTDDERFGASADGLIGDDGGAEYKAFLAPEKLRPILIDGDWGDVRDQAQGCMWLTGRKWWHLCLFCPALEPVGKELVIYREERDDDYIEAMERDLLAFDEVVERFKGQLLGNKQEAA